MSKLYVDREQSDAAPESWDSSSGGICFFLKSNYYRARAPCLSKKVATPPLQWGGSHFRSRDEYYLVQVEYYLVPGTPSF